MADPNLTPALQEAYASASPQRRIIHTIEISHPDFDNTLYIVADYRPNDTNAQGLQKMTANIETGQEVEFLCFAFELGMPHINTAPAPEIKLTIDNAGRELMQALRLASISDDDVVMKYRAYTQDNLNNPAMSLPYQFILHNITVTPLQIQASCKVKTVGNNTFPSENYNVKDYQGLQ